MALSALDWATVEVDFASGETQAPFISLLVKIAGLLQVVPVGFVEVINAV